MSKDTNIEWCDSTVNPTMGCDGCELWNEKTGVKTCYAGVLHDRYGGHNKGFSPKFNILTEHPGRMAAAAKWSDLRGKDRPDKPWLSGMPRTIFISDMSDALSKAVSFDYLYQEIFCNVVSNAGKRHIWMWLTKVPSRMKKFEEYLHAKGLLWPDNLWAGTSITSQTTTPRIGNLVKVGAKVRFLSIEPIQGPISLMDGDPENSGPDLAFPVLGMAWSESNAQYERIAKPGIDWVILGGGSGDGAVDLNINWMRTLIEQLCMGNMPTFVKQLGSRPYEPPNHDGGTGYYLGLKYEKGGNPAEWPEPFRVREMPPYAF